MNLNYDVADEQELVLPTGVTITYRWSPREPDWVDLLGLESKHRNQGHASRALDELLAFADENKLSVSVYARQWETTVVGLNTCELADWYLRHGFETSDTYRPTREEMADPDHIGVDLWRNPNKEL